MDSPPLHPAQYAGTPEHGEHSERADEDTQLVSTRAHEQRVLPLIEEMVNRLKSVQSALIKNDVENWLECAGKSRKKELKKGRDEFENHSNLKRLEEKRYECAILARMEFGTVTRKFDDECEIAEQKEAKQMTENLNWLSDEICQGAPKLCREFAADFENFITQEAIDRAERFSEERFTRLSQDRVENANSRAQDGVKRVCEIEKGAAKDIIERQWILLQRAQANADNLVKEGDIRFIEKLSQTETRKVTRKKTAEKISQSEPDLTRKRMSNVAIPSDRQTEVAGHRHHESFEKLALSHRLLADFNASMCRLRQGDGNDGGCRAVSPISPTGDTNTTMGGEPSAGQHQSECHQSPTEDTNTTMGGEPSAGQHQSEYFQSPTEDTNTTMGSEPSAAQHQSERLQLPTMATQVAMGGEPSDDPHQLEKRILQCLETISEATDRNTALIELMVSRTMHAQPGATGVTTPLSTPEDSSDETTLLKVPKNVGRFKSPARPTSQKDAEELRLRAAVRNHAKEMMGVTRNNKTEPAPKEAIDKYISSGKEEDGPSKDRFVADFSQASPKNSPWNVRLAEIFVNDYLQNGHPFRQLKDISDFFYTYLHSLRTNYRNRTTVNSTGRGTVNDDHSKRSRIEQRKKSRFGHQLSALDYHMLDRFVKPLSEMSHKVLSDDESDHENGTNLGRPCYSIVQEAWRSEELIKWLRTIDLLSLGEKWDGRLVAQRGNGRRFRVHSNRSKDGEAVFGLPENCYDSGWLSSLKEYERNSLQVKPPLDLTFSEQERSLAAKYIPLAKGEHGPLTNPDTSGLDEWLLNRFGKVRDV